MEDIKKRLKSREFSALIRRESIDKVAKIIALYRAVRMNRNDQLTGTEIEYLKQLSDDMHYVITRELVDEFITIAKDVTQVIPRATIRTLSKIASCVGVMEYVVNITTPLAVDVLVVLTHEWLEDLGMGWDVEHNTRRRVDWASVTGMAYAFLWRIPAKWVRSNMMMVAAGLTHEFWCEANATIRMPCSVESSYNAAFSGGTSGTERAIARLPDAVIAWIATSPVNGDDYLMIVKKELAAPTKPKLSATAFMELSRLAFPKKGSVQTRFVAKQDTMIFIERCKTINKNVFENFNTFNGFLADTMLRTLLAQLDEETYYVFKDVIDRRIEPSEVELRVIMLLVEQIRSLQDAFFDEDLYLPESGEHLQEWYKERYSITKLTGRHLHEQYSFNNLYG